MHMIFRTLLIFLQRKLLKPARLDEITESTMRVWPTDLDILMHVNNGVYFSLMDFGRWDMIFRNGVYDLSRKMGWYSVVGGETIKFIRSLNLWDKFTIRTQIVGRDEKYFFISQKFLRQNEVIAIGLVKVRFLKVKGGTVSTAEVLQQSPEATIPEALDLSTEWSGFDRKYLS